MALPRVTLARSGDPEVDRRRLADLVVEEGAVVVVVGLPLSLDGTRGPAALAAADEAEALRLPPRAADGIAVELFDERLTTVTAHQALATTGGPRAGPAPGGRPGRRRRAARGLAGAGVGGSTGDRAGGGDLHPTDRTGAGSGRRPTRHRWRVAIAVLVAAVAVLVVVGGALWVQAESGASGKPGSPGHRHGGGRQRDRPAGRHPGGQGGDRQFAGLPDLELSSTAQPELVPGTYAFDKNLSFAAADQIIAGGPNVFPLVIPPGFTVREVAERVGQLPGHDQSAFDALATGGTVRSPWQPAGSTNLDGLLGTGTYVVVPGETDRQLLTDMVDRFDKEADAVGLASRSAALGLTPYQVSPWPPSWRRRGSSPRTSVRWPGSSSTGWTTACPCRWTRPSSTPRVGTAGR